MEYGIYQNAGPESKREPAKITIPELSEQMQEKKPTTGNSKNSAAEHNLKEECRDP